MVIDDDELIRRLAAIVLRSRQYQVLSAATGEEALSLLKTADQPVSVVVTDITMPGISGCALIRALRKIDPAVKIVVVSGRPGELLPAEMEALGVTAVLAKPCPPTAFVQAVEAAISAGTTNDF